MRALILYATFTGTCKYYAECFKTTLEAADYVVDIFNATSPANREDILKNLLPASEYDVIGFGSAIAMNVFITPFKDFIVEHFDEYIDGKFVFTFATATATQSGVGIVGKHLVKKGGKFVGHFFWESTANYPPLGAKKTVVLTKTDLEVPRSHASDLVNRLNSGETVKPPAIGIGQKISGGLGYNDKIGGKFGFSKVKIDPERCIGCNKCVKVCPTGAMSLDSNKIAIRDRKLCQGCYACYHVCPKAAIKMRAANPDVAPQFQFNETYVKMIEEADLPKRHRVTKAEWDELKAKVGRA
ncbi:4Fe-4S dicluster domain [Carpediemonas membranifera]|uniref:4Fe-4S dicluster domain n=1 Tax=Carpediemonas membranifera TaxID=201153 RepID=A0A8J6E0S2_9EUKA|nr:4Fe-4S dicluster domain [Carpediemonas membranifera]|eukprot:KAG9392201.1 4Fe-4S dicluster domain [Carpediemonas membranifera]